MQKPVHKDLPNILNELSSMSYTRPNLALLGGWKGFAVDFNSTDT